MLIPLTSLTLLREIEGYLAFFWSCPFHGSLSRFSGWIYERAALAFSIEFMARLDLWRIRLQKGHSVHLKDRTHVTTWVGTPHQNQCRYFTHPMHKHSRGEVLLEFAVLPNPCFTRRSIFGMQVAAARRSWLLWGALLGSTAFCRFNAERYETVANLTLPYSVEWLSPHEWL